MFIQTEATPNPATLKFLPGRDVLVGEPRDFRTRGMSDGGIGSARHMHELSRPLGFRQSRRARSRAW